MGPLSAVSTAASAVSNAAKWTANSTANALTLGWWNSGTQADAGSATDKDTATGEVTDSKGATEADTKVSDSEADKPIRYVEKTRALYDPWAWMPSVLGGTSTYIEREDPLPQGVLGRTIGYATAPIGTLASVVSRPLTYATKSILGTERYTKYGKYVNGGVNVKHYIQTTGGQLTEVGHERGNAERLAAEVADTKPEGTTSERSPSHSSAGGTIPETTKTSAAARDTAGTSLSQPTAKDPLKDKKIAQILEKFQASIAAHGTPGSTTDAPPAPSAVAPTA
ncbi:hypothetical protein BD324DRAFT_652869 [Kockovaella imperatae]|uniref:Uncharacterized protein n=1 Tax=Kockovaella imperatae TaxID=4999 RepID=A0A1Y1UC97_9TREE|nr:hypothetical protein BD324DRAFT_652869 [Kockovaella imperatae]ORX35157.1 hypothetical protein BD324DRAFT_652869 [Kockovaella imperatae]